MIGMRTFKTALAVGICFLTYDIFIPSNDYIGPFYGSIAAVITMQPSLERSKMIGQNRVLGTIVGGVYSALLYSLYIQVGIEKMNFLFLFFGIILVIKTCTKLGIPSGVSTGCIVLIGAFGLTFTTTPLMHAVYRTIDTMYGVIIAIAINHLLPGPE